MWAGTRTPIGKKAWSPWRWWRPENGRSKNSGGFGFAGKKKLEQQFPKTGRLLPKPFGPTDVTLAQTPGLGVSLPHKPNEVTEPETASHLVCTWNLTTL